MQEHFGARAQRALLHRGRTLFDIAAEDRRRRDGRRLAGHASFADTPIRGRAPVARLRRDALGRSALGASAPAAGRMQDKLADTAR